MSSDFDYHTTLRDPKREQDICVVIGHSSKPSKRNNFYHCLAWHHHGHINDGLKHSFGVCQGRVLPQENHVITSFHFQKKTLAIFHTFLQSVNFIALFPSRTHPATQPITSLILKSLTHLNFQLHLNLFAQKNILKFHAPTKPSTG